MRDFAILGVILEEARLRAALSLADWLAGTPSVGPYR